MDKEPLKVVIIGAGIGGLSAGISLRQQGHSVRLYDRVDSFDVLGGGGLGIVSNATRLLEGNWGIDLAKAGAVPVKNLVIRDWKSSTTLKRADMGDYKARFGYEYYGTVRVDVHQVLLNAACDDKSSGPPCAVFLGHKLKSLDYNEGICKFANGVEVKADLVIGADGIKSEVRRQIGITPHVTPAPVCCYRFVVSRDDLRSVEMQHLLETSTINFWPGPKQFYRIIAGPADHGRLLCLYGVFPRNRNSGLQDFDWQVPATVAEMKDTFSDVDPNLHKVFELAKDLHLWRQTIHDEYPYWWKGKVCLLGDAAHPMLPDQNQGFSQAVEDAGAIGAIFSKLHAPVFRGDVSKALILYEKVRRARATTVQTASLKASQDFRERAGFKDPNDSPEKLTIEWLCEYDLPEDVANVISEFQKSSETQY